HPLSRHPGRHHAPGALVAAGGSVKKRLTSILLHMALVLGAMLTLLPLVWMIMASLMPTGEASSEPPPFFPSHVTFDHYRELFVHLNLGRVLFNSALLAVSVTVLSVLLNAM